MSDKDAEDKSVSFVKAAIDSGIPEEYANGFQILAGQADVVMILQRNGKSVESINMSFTVAKSLAQALSEVIQQIEAATGMDIKTSKQIAKSLGENKA